MAASVAYRLSEGVVVAQRFTLRTTNIALSSDNRLRCLIAEVIAVAMRCSRFVEVTR